MGYVAKNVWMIGIDILSLGFMENLSNHSKL